MSGRLALPPDDDLAAELCAPRFEYRAGGLIVVESKDDTKRRIGRSPDKADAVVYACWTDKGDADRDYDPDGRNRLHPVRYAEAAEFDQGHGIFDPHDFDQPRRHSRRRFDPDDVPWPVPGSGVYVSPMLSREGPWD